MWEIERSPKDLGAGLPVPAASRDTDEALARLGAALLGRIGDPPAVDSLRGLIDAFCAHARREHVSPEHMLVRLKHTIDGVLPNVSGSPGDRDTMRALLVSMAIDAYYDDGGPHGRR